MIIRKNTFIRLFTFVFLMQFGGSDLFANDTKKARAKESVKTSTAAAYLGTHLLRCETKQTLLSKKKQEEKVRSITFDIYGGKRSWLGKEWLIESGRRKAPYRFYVIDSKFRTLSLARFNKGENNFSNTIHLHVPFNEKPLDLTLNYNSNTATTKLSVDFGNGIKTFDCISALELED